MAVIASPRRPRSAPHESWRYCDTVRVGSSANTETVKQTPASPAMAHLNSKRLPKPSSRQVFELLNHNLAWLLHRIFFACNDVKDQTEYCLTRNRDGGRELMFRNQLRSVRCGSSTKSLEGCTSSFPAQD